MRDECESRLSSREIQLNTVRDKRGKGGGGSEDRRYIKGVR